METVCRSVGKENIKPLVAEKLQGHALASQPHLPLSVLVLSFRLVAHGAPKPQYPDPLVGVDAVFYADTVVGRVSGIPVVVVAVDIQHRCRSEGGQKGQIFRGQISAGEDQIHALQSPLVEIVPQTLGLHIRDG